MNNFLREVETSSPGYDLHVDFSKGFTGERLSDLFMDDGLIGMLEAADIKTVDMLSPFLGALIDTYCGEFDKAPVTTVFTQYVDLVDVVYRRNQVPGWSELELPDLSGGIASYQQLSGASWSYLELSAVVRGYLALSAAVCSYLQLSGATWIKLLC